MKLWCIGFSEKKKRVKEGDEPWKEGPSFRLVYRPNWRSSHRRWLPWFGRLTGCKPDMRRYLRLCESMMPPREAHPVQKNAKIKNYGRKKEAKAEMTVYILHGIQSMSSRMDRLQSRENRCKTLCSCLRNQTPASFQIYNQLCYRWNFTDMVGKWKEIKCGHV